MYFTRYTVGSPLQKNAIIYQIFKAAVQLSNVAHG